MKRAWPLALAALVGCGGGSDDAPPAGSQPPPSSIAASAAMRALLTTPRTATASGTGSDGQSYQLTYVVTPQGAGTLDGGALPVDVVQFASTLRAGGVVTSAATTTWFVRQGTSRVEAVRRSDGDCGRATAPSEPPNTAALLAGGPLYSMSIFDGCSSGGFSFETETATWSVESEGSVAYLCVRVAFTGIGAPGGGATQQLCVQSSSAGALGPAVRFTITQGTAFNVTLRGTL